MKLTYIDNKFNLCPKCGKEMLFYKDKCICISSLIGICDFTLLKKESLENSKFNKFLSLFKKYSFRIVKINKLVSLFKLKNNYSELKNTLKLNIKANKYYNSLLVYNNMDKKINKRISLNIDTENRNILRKSNNTYKQNILPKKDLNYVNNKSKNI